MQRSDTQAISIGASPCAVIDLVSDAAQFPRWAAGFARAVHVDGDDWIVDTGEGEVRLSVRVSRKHGTVDFLLADAPRGAEIGVFARVLRNGCGSELVFTRFFPDAMSATEIDDERAVVSVELQTVRALCERGRLRAAA